MTRRQFPVLFSIGQDHFMQSVLEHEPEFFEVFPLRSYFRLLYSLPT